MVFNIKEIKAESKRNFRETWIETAKLLPAKSSKNYAGGRGTPHPIHELAQKSRQAFIELGFDEIENPVFVTEEDVYKQYGPEAPVILDRCYYLAGLPRPDIGLGDEKINEIKKINSGVNVDEFKRILREYREGSIEGDNLLESMVNRLGIRTEEAAQIVDLFPEFKNIVPVAGKMTLRSHMTAAWFPTIQAMIQRKYPIPMRLFSVGLRFRREQKVDSSHLRAHYGASCVVMDSDVTLEDGKKITESILGRLEFKDFSFVQKKATSNYYAPETEFEVYASGIEIADIGMYSPVALANYDIAYPIFNLGFGLERVLMVKSNIRDVRELLYPQFYGSGDLSDQDIASSVSIAMKPESAEGREIVGKIVETAGKHGSEDSPCRFLAYKDSLLGKNIEVYVIEKEANTKLLGPAALNEIYAHNSGIYGIPKDPKKLKESLVEVKEKGVYCGFTILDAISNHFASEIEKQVRENKNEGFIQVKMAKTPADANIHVSERARQYITSKNKEISVKGPVFTAVEYRVV